MGFLLLESWIKSRNLTLPIKYVLIFINTFHEKVNNLLEKWQVGIDADVRDKIQIINFRETQRNPESKKTRLRVTFDNGKKIEESFAAATFVLAIKEMGFSKVEALGLTTRGFPLIDTKKSNNNKYNQHQIDGKYVCVHSSTTEKKKTLEKIANQLGVGLKVDIIQ